MSIPALNTKSWDNVLEIKAIEEERNKLKKVVCYLNFNHSWDNQIEIKDIEDK